MKLPHFPALRRAGALLSGGMLAGLLLFAANPAVASSSLAGAYLFKSVSLVINGAKETFSISPQQKFNLTGEGVEGFPSEVKTFVKQFGLGGFKITIVTNTLARLVVDLSGSQNVIEVNQNILGRKVVLSKGSSLQAALKNNTLTLTMTFKGKAAGQPYSAKLTLTFVKKK
jgi:hypothetical protein